MAGRQVSERKKKDRKIERENWLSVIVPTFELLFHHEIVQIKEFVCNHKADSSKSKVSSLQSDVCLFKVLT